MFTRVALSELPQQNPAVGAPPHGWAFGSLSRLNWRSAFCGKSMQEKKKAN
jgi:hypothetical protein